MVSTLPLVNTEDSSSAYTMLYHRDLFQRLERNLHETVCKQVWFQDKFESYTMHYAIAAHGAAQRLYVTYSFNPYSDLYIMQLYW